MSRSRIIVAGSPNPTPSPLGASLELAGYRVAEVANAVQTARATASGLYDVLILDSRMEGVCEYELCRTIRPKSDLGIILVIRDNDRQTRIDALEAGADDYVIAPFVTDELLARVRALLRRIAPARRTKLELSERTVDLQTREVTGPDCHTNHLTPKEFDVLQYLLTHANRPVSHRKLASAVWQKECNGDFEYLRVVIGQLRRKLELSPENPQHILTERALGYRLKTHLAGTDAEIPATAAQLGCVQAAVQTDTPAMVQ